LNNSGGNWQCKPALCPSARIATVVMTWFHSIGVVWLEYPSTLSSVRDFALKTTPLRSWASRHITCRPYSITPLQRRDTEKMVQYTIKNSKECCDTRNSFYNGSVAHDWSQILAWLSPLEPSVRHREIQEHRVDNVGEWLIQTEEFRRWCGLSGESEGNNTVLFCYGDPGVGKTFIR